MRKGHIFSGIISLIFPLTLIAVSTPTNTNTYNKTVVSGEGTLKFTSGNIRAINIGTGTIKKPRTKSALEIAVEKQKEREAELARQHQEQQEQEDRQRAIKSAYEAKQQADNKVREAELQKRQTNETIESYCARAEQQGFLLSKWKVNTVSECIRKLKNLERAGKKIVENRTKAMLERKRLGDRLKRLCIEEYTKTGKVSEFCANVLTPRTSTGTTQTGGTISVIR